MGEVMLVGISFLTVIGASGGGDGGGIGALTLMVVGMVVVFAALVVLAFVIGAIGRLFPAVESATRSAADAAESAARAAEAASAARGGARAGGAGVHDERVLADESLSPELVAVIAAAASAALGARVRVKRVFELRDDVRPWISGGRAEVMQSHRLGGVGQFRAR